jgi:mRNA interferase MazF
LVVPERQQFIWLSFDPQTGHEQQGRRPALVMSNSSFNAKMGFVFVCPISNTQRNNPFYISLPNGLSIQGKIFCDQLKSLDYRAKNAEIIEECPSELFEKVLTRITLILSS